MQRQEPTTDTQKQQAPQVQPSLAGAGSMQSQNILGSKLSIVTTAFVRYEGILREVDPINKAMTLINIRCFGTEGRRGGDNEIAPSTTDIGEARFKVDHIKDFKIIGKPEPMLLDPAIISSTIDQPEKVTTQVAQAEVRAPKEDQPKQEQKPGSGWRNFENNPQSQQQNYGGGRGGGDYQRPQQRYGQDQPRGGGDYPRPQQHYSQEQSRGGYQQRGYQQNTYSGNQGYQGKSNYYGNQNQNYRGRGNNYQGDYQQRPQRKVGEMEENPNEQLKESLKETFDFQAHQIQPTDKAEHGDQEDSKSAHSQDREKEEVPKYDKSNGFFDQISNSTQAQKGDSRIDGRQKDSETFGLASQNFRYSDRGRGRGRGRGGRGNYYQGGRGGYQSNQGESEDQQEGGYRGGRGGYNNRGRGDYVQRGGYTQEEGRGGQRGGYRGSRGGYNSNGTDFNNQRGGYKQYSSNFDQEEGRGGRGSYQQKRGSDFQYQPKGGPKEDDF